MKDVKIEITNPKFICNKCKKSFYHPQIETFAFKGDIICVCHECANKIEKFIKESDE